jgi:nucleoid-associated protein YgaU
VFTSILKYNILSSLAARNSRFLKISITDISSSQAPEPSNEESSLEGKWEGVAEEIVEESEIAEQEEILEDVQVVQNIPTVQEIVVSVPEEESQTSTYAAYKEPVYYKVQSNDNLFKIAREHYGDGQKWIKIFEANSDSMPDSNSLYVGQVILIPDISAEKESNVGFLAQVSGRVDKERPVNVDTHTVKAGDTLYRIAEEYYDDASVWTKILEANEDTLEDEGSLIKGQVLILPRLR